MQRYLRIAIISYAQGQGGDDPFEVVLADHAKQRGTISIEMPRQQNARVVADDPPEDRFAFH